MIAHVGFTQPYCAIGSKKFALGAFPANQMPNLTNCDLLAYVRGLLLVTFIFSSLWPEWNAGFLVGKNLKHLACFLSWIARSPDDIHKFSNNNSSKNKITEHLNNYLPKPFKWSLLFELAVSLDEGKIDEVLHETDGNRKMCSQIIRRVFEPSTLGQTNVPNGTIVSCSLLNTAIDGEFSH